jgi:beta-1,2-mannobiose phosphorylase / 1,2-beta-oligomannan phosphorylase
VVERHDRNPLIRPSDVEPTSEGMSVVGVFNPAACRIDGRTILVLRVAEQPVQSPDEVTVARWSDSGDGSVVLSSFARSDPRLVLKDRRFFFHDRDVYYTSLSHLRLAASDDGRTFTVSTEPWLVGSSSLDSFGLEDPRVSVVGGRFHITYTAVSTGGAGTALAVTSDWRDITEHGLIFLPTNKNCVLLPDRIDNRYVAFHRPSGRGMFNNNIWLAESPDLVSWGRHRCVAATRPGQWDSVRLGIGPQPVRCEAGWLALYYGVDEHRVYRVGILLLDADRPWNVLARSSIPLMGPEEQYEREGFFPNVLFPSGLVEQDGRWILYYGAGDRCVCVADIGTTTRLLATLE